MIRTILFTTSILLAAPAFAAGTDEPMTPVRAFVAAIDKGDMKAAIATHVDAPGIIDEFPPHHWSSLAAWATDYGNDAKLHGDTDGILIMHAVHRLTVDGDTAYAVVPTDFSYKRHGKRVVEAGTITYALAHTAKGWRIAGWTYSW